MQVTGPNSRLEAGYKLDVQRAVYMMMVMARLQAVAQGLGLRA